MPLVPLLFLFQLQLTDSLYTSAALRRFVDDASRLNRNVPAELHSYQARAESEIAILVHLRNGVEAPFSLEQTQSEVTWQQPGAFEQHVTAYRQRSASPQLSSLGFFRQAWTIPHLYGNRLQLLFGRESPTAHLRRHRPSAPLVAVHPLAEDRDRIYRFSGGDTVITMRFGGRAIPIVRVLVTPRKDAPRQVVAFDGELDLDAVRHHLVRMRGRFVTLGARKSALQRIATLAFESVAYVELEDAEVGDGIWLPSFQRIEAQAFFRTADELRSVFRVESRFQDHRLNTMPLAQSTISPSDTLEERPHSLTLASTDSLGRGDEWTYALGALTADARAEDFDEHAPESWRATGRPQLVIRGAQSSDFLHVNRVDGVFTGIAAAYWWRDAAPGLKLESAIGWAWNARVPRGRVRLTRERGGERWLAHASGSLEITNDFRSALDSGSAFAAAFGVDDYDYVDRRVAGIGWFGRMEHVRGVTLHGDLSAVADREVGSQLTGSPLGIGAQFRPNRKVSAGRYLRTIVTIDADPSAGTGLMTAGTAASLSYEGGEGDLAYQRIETRLVTRHDGVRLSIAARVDAGLVAGRRIPGQQLFEVGSTQSLPGYGYKQFAGNRAIVVRALAMHTLPLLRSPIRLVPRVILPGLSPALSASVQGAWLDIDGAKARRALTDLSGVQEMSAGEDLCGAGSESQVPVSRPTCGWRATVALGVRFFHGVIGIEMARPVDHSASWRLVVSAGQVF